MLIRLRRQDVSRAGQPITARWWHLPATTNGASASGLPRSHVCKPNRDGRRFDARRSGSSVFQLMDVADGDALSRRGSTNGHLRERRIPALSKSRDPPFLPYSSNSHRIKLEQLQHESDTIDKSVRAVYMSAINLGWGGAAGIYRYPGNSPEQLFQRGGG